MESYIKNHVKILEIFEPYICNNSSECKIDLNETSITMYLSLKCKDNLGNIVNVYFDMLLTGKTLFCTFSKRRGSVLDSDKYDLNKVFSYDLLRELINNYIPITLKHYGYDLYVEKTDIVTIKPTRVLDNLFAYIYASRKASLIFGGTPNTRNMNLQVPNCDITFSIDVYDEEGVTLYYAGVHKVEAGSPKVNKVVHTIERQLNLEEALKATVDKL